MCPAASPVVVLNQVLRPKIIEILLSLWEGLAHDVDDELAKALALTLGEVLEDVTVFLVQELEANREVVVLQNGLIVVHEGQL